MEQAPGALADPTPEVEARDDDDGDPERELAEADPERSVIGGERDDELGEGDRDGPVQAQERAVDAGQAEADGRQVLVEA